MLRIALRAITASAAIQSLGRFADDSGASILEYCLVLAIVSVAAIAGLTLVGNHSAQTLSTVAGSISS